ncbi:hypothetical protein DFA_00902 [Cavenderia fasciculata]|uniref:Uncharacterized protein n=1 Tax=Cavenderia fasciculata TaxID=261658 RepID=F4PUG0_CACFS|nr:uncharacterized protein DFA_00902 [Cavenderia fasciculata]EGG21032.1 hypothetical protein DFA_00902 [Cavenderia fasciculata]|eukprot:XP_004358882.1 hypothetical protein DFA_00902 [Cavenderia fasciculata]
MLSRLFNHHSINHSGRSICTITGKLSFHETHYLLQGKINGSFPHSFRFDPGTSQISTHHASCVGFKSHPLLLGKSTMTNGDIKYDYLCQGNLFFDDIEIPMIYKVAPHQPALFGLDASMKLNLKFDFLTGDYLITKPTLSHPKSSLFRSIDYDSLLKDRGIDKSQLLPIDQLPTPRETYKSLVLQHKENSIYELDTSFNHGMYISSLYKN